MKLVCCALTVMVLAACAKGNHSATSGTSAEGGTTSTAASGNVGRPVIPERTAAPNAATGASQPHASSAPAQPAPAIARVAGPTGRLGSKKSRARSSRDTGTTPRDTGAAASSRTSAPPTTSSSASTSSDSVKVNQFMSYDKAKKTVTIDIFAAYNTNLGGFNMNGGSSGSDTITVPEGWSVTMPVVNKDAIPHSAIIIASQMPLPVTPHEPAIPLAYTTHLTDGLQPQGGHDTMRFKTEKAGQYILACGVPGHATSGMWIHFNVSKTATVPSYAMHQSK